MSVTIQHTLGPWEIYKDVNGITISALNGGRSICDIVGDMPIDEANAIAISAVPELLAACEEWMKIWRHLRDAYPDIEVPIELNPLIHGADSCGRLRFAIAKARGQA
jgi:hypothetical protein